jgi:acetamidase/formamidase
LKLPVEVSGALFSCGDVHAAQGDGEVAGTGIEIDAVVTLRLSLEKGRAPATPVFIAPDPPNRGGPWFVAAGSDTDPREAARIALQEVISYLRENRGLTLAQGLILSSACVDLRVSQLVNAGTWTISASLPLGIFDS